MWLIGAFLGFVMGSLIHRHGSFLGLVLGGFVGWLIGQLRQEAAQKRERPLLERLELVETQVAALQSELRQLKQRIPSETRVAEAAESAPTLKAAPADAVAAVAPLPLQGKDEGDGDERTEVLPPIPVLPEEVERKGFTTMELPEPSRLFSLPTWLQRLWEGNPLAKVGIVLLFFGIASGLKLAADHGLLPISLRLFLAAALGIGLIVLGVAKVRDAATPELRAFGLVLQGGGFALLYLVAYFMLARYALIRQELAFGLFALLGVVCVLMAAKQDGPVLAVLGLTGAFLAPVLAGGRADSPLGLFAYFALLNAFILGVDWFKSWRALNVAGFLFTLVIGMAWAMRDYEPRHYLVTQSFLALFLAAYSAMPVATALLRAPGLAGWQDALLLFGTPLVGAFLQTCLMADVEYGLAWSALLASLWYFGLWALLLRRPEAQNRLIADSHLGIAIALLTVSVPLAFGAQLTSAFWAAEGMAVLWFGLRTQRPFAQGAGLLMQLAAGLALLRGWHGLTHRLPVLNDAMLGAFILVLAGLMAARWLRDRETAGQSDPSSQLGVPAVLPFVWALVWWLAAGLAEIERFAPFAHHAPYGLLYIAATVAATEGLARQWRWPQLRASALLLLAGIWIAAWLTIDRSGHPLAGLMVIVLPLALALHYRLLALHETSQPPVLAPLNHLGAWWLILLLLPQELSWLSARLAPGVALWPFMAWGLVLAAGIVLPVWGRERFWPFNASVAGYVPIGVGLPALVLVLVLAWGMGHLSGATGALALPYLPVLNFFDATVLAGLAALLQLGRALDADYRRPGRAVLLLLAFVWLSTLAARIAHHWGGVPFEFAAMARSTLFQSILTIFWTVTAIATMITASRRALREVWYGGFGLLGIVGAKLLLFDATGRGTLTWTGTLIGVALLVLAASYFAPMPPRAAVDD